jgi:hypothetical protein
MDYATIQSTALAYADRANDPEVVANVDNMLRLVEAKVNRALLVMASTSRLQVPITDVNQEYYDLPAGFSSFRSIKIATATDISAKRYTLYYVTPAVMDNKVTYNMPGDWYTIEANKIWVYSEKKVVGNFIEYVSYADIVPLSNSATTNWLSISYPDCYVMGLVMEIALMTKNFTLYSGIKDVFKEILGEIDVQDDRLTWSGSPIQVVVE